MESGDSAGDQSDPTREHGIEFGQLKEQLESHDYPATGEKLLAAYGDSEIGLPEGSTTFRDVLGERERDRDGSEEVRYESAEEIQQAVLNMVGSAAVGRENYSDRGSANHNEPTNGADSDDQSI